METRPYEPRHRESTRSAAKLRFWLLLLILAIWTAIMALVPLVSGAEPGLQVGSKVWLVLADGKHVKARVVATPSGWMLVFANGEDTGAFLVSPEGGTPGPTPPQPTPTPPTPTPPTPTPETLTGLAKLSLDWSAAVKTERQAAAKIAAAFQGAATRIAAGDLATPADCVAAVYASTHLTLTPAEGQAWGPWWEACRVWFAAEAKAGKLKTAKDHQQPFTDLSRGLKEVK
ncbi:MAG: hypothetical protein ABFD92_21635 [Planctomycetaceae bacterium]